MALHPQQTGKVVGGKRIVPKQAKHLHCVQYSTAQGDNGTRPDNKRAQYGEKSTSVITKRAHGCIEKEMGIR
ncbi:hypothetical protein T4A_6637 [Trichinella pseudospiralis]|uniref:Uncharacterized protein n=1 Tax=Trichinella pseudospiralis TaxID=6337 RepID=A0A0V1DUG2_TRIPS|nr:hypothetical protein T4A_6637 [Trichinella pseudospiralis]